MLNTISALFSRKLIGAGGIVASIVWLIDKGFQVYANDVALMEWPFVWGLIALGWIGGWYVASQGAQDVAGLKYGGKTDDGTSPSGTPGSPPAQG